MKIYLKKLVRNRIRDMAALRIARMKKHNERLKKQRKYAQENNVYEVWKLKNDLIN